VSVTTREIAARQNQFVAQAASIRLIAAIADGLTALRLIAAMVLLVFAWSGIWQGVAVTLTVAWLSDFLDGRMARQANGLTKLGPFDLPADTAVGAGLLIGLIGAGEIPAWLGIGALVLFGAVYAAGNLAASMLLQLSGFLPTLWVLWRYRPPAWWLPVVTALGIAILDWEQLMKVNIPGFIRGITGHFDRAVQRGD